MEKIGEILKKTRKDRRVTLEELSRNLNISREIISALENCNYEGMPGEPYTSGFIRSYSNYFNLDTDFIINKYKDEKSVEVLVPDLKMPVAINPSYYVYFKYGFTSFILISLIVVFYNFFYLQTNLDEIYAITPDLENEMIALVEEEDLKISLKRLEDFKTKEQERKKLLIDDIIKSKVNDSLSKNSAVANISEEINEKTIVLKFLGDTWVQIKDSKDKLIINKLMKMNDEFILDASSYYFLTTGNAGNIQVMKNNKIINKLGKKGEVLNAFQLSSDFK